MDDRGLAERNRQREVPAEVVELRVDRRERPVEVEAGLAYGDDALVGRQARDGRPAVVVDARRFVRMDADGGIEPRELVDEREARRARPDVPTRNEDALDAGEPR